MSKEQIREAILNAFSTVSDFFWDLFPDSPFYYIAYMLFIMAIGLFIIIYFSKKQPKKVTPITPKEDKKEIKINNLLEIANNPNSSLQDLMAALLMFEQNFKVEDDYKNSMEFFKKLLNHKNANSKKIFQIFHGQILPSNLKYKDELNKIEQEALNNK